MIFENLPQLGNGIYTPSEIAKIFRMPLRTVSDWIRLYWDGQLGKGLSAQYSWMTDGAKGVSFHTFIELYVMMQLTNAGVKPQHILEAHRNLSKKNNSAFPFALKDVLSGIRTDGSKIYFEDGEANLISLDGTGQLNLSVIAHFFKMLDFGDDSLASRYWPMGRESTVMMDPQRKFGHPVIEPTNIYPETLCDLYDAGDPVAYIAHIYELTEAQVNDAIAYCKAA